MAGSKAKANGHVDEKNVMKSSPVLEAVSKRIRNAKKRLRGVEEIEGKRDQFLKGEGRPLNADQEAALASKPALLASIEELERLYKALAGPLAEEIAAAAAAAREAALASVPEPEPVTPAKSDEEWLREKEEAVEAAKSEGAAAAAAAAAEAETAAAEAASKALTQGISALLEILYYAAVFDPYLPFPHPAQYERHAALTYAAHKQVGLSGEDLDAVALVGKLLTAKPFGAAISHAEALERCKELAITYITHPATPLPGLQLSGDAVRSKLTALMSTDYCVVVPQGVPATGVGAGPQAMPPRAVPTAAAVGQEGRGGRPRGQPVRAAPAPQPQQQHQAPLQQAAVAVEEVSERTTPPAPAGEAPQAPPPSSVPTPSALASRPGPAAAAAPQKPQNLVEKLFGVNPAAAAGGGAPAGHSESVAFVGDAHLGIEGVPLEADKPPSSGPAPAAGATAGATASVAAPRVLDAPRPPRPAHFSSQPQHDGDGQRGGGRGARGGRGDGAFGRRGGATGGEGRGRGSGGYRGGRGGGAAATEFAQPGRGGGGGYRGRGGRREGSRGGSQHSSSGSLAGPASQ